MAVESGCDTAFKRGCAESGCVVWQKEWRVVQAALFLVGGSRLLKLHLRLTQVCYARFHNGRKTDVVTCWITCSDPELRSRLKSTQSHGVHAIAWPGQSTLKEDTPPLTSDSETEMSAYVSATDSEDEQILVTGDGIFGMYIGGRLEQQLSQNTRTHD